MKSFLEYVAEDIISKYGNNLSHVAVVFPNKRASLFLNEYLARMVNRPLWSPTYITISDLFRKHSKRMISDQIKLICILHRIYREVTGSNETLDHFYGWGQLLLADFDDIDKNLADAAKVFANLRDIHELDDISYLDDNQKEMLSRFFANFSEEQESELKHKFITLWSNFHSIYSRYNDVLKENGIAYEGALYREVTEQENIEFKYDTYLFVGFNMMQTVEQKLCSKLQKSGKAHFYWDFDNYYLEHNEAGTYIRQYLPHFPNELDIHDKDIYDNMRHQKDISYISATTENIQARYVAQWLRENGRIAAGRNTAIVLADENLLPTVIHCLPPEVKNVNITTGYPLQQSPVASLVKTLIALRFQGYRSDLEYYRLHWLQMILRHPYASLISDNVTELLKDISKSNKFYFSIEELSKDDSLKLLFNETSHDVRSINSWIIQIIQLIGNHYAETVNCNDSKKPSHIENPLMQESLFRMYTLLNRLSSLIDEGYLDIDVNTYTKLIGQLIQTTSIPFHGEPVIGVQIMGVLETRNLDFEHVLVLSCGEGNMPKGVNDSSFIPYSIRKAYGLTTIDNKVAIYAYYFHSLLQRATDISLLYNNATSNTSTGEMSRFMLQLMVESGQNIRKYSLNAQQEPISVRRQKIKKDSEIMEKLNSIKRISPTALNVYLRCQLMFYYTYILGIRQTDNEDDEIDNQTFGNIFHHAAELFYKPMLEHGGIVHQSDLEDAKENKVLLERIVDQAFNELLFKVPVNTHMEYNGLQIINRHVLINYLRQMIELDLKLTPFTLQGLELKVSHKFEIPLPEGNRLIDIYGTIDRMDEIDIPGKGACIRVIDYKTGSNNKMNIKQIDDIFNPEMLSNHSDYYLQSMLYSLIVRYDKKYNPDLLPVSPALLFIQHAKEENYDPTLLLTKEKIIDIATWKDDFINGIKQLIADILNPSMNFNPTDNIKQCDTCPYHQICYALAN